MQNRRKFPKITANPTSTGTQNSNSAVESYCLSKETMHKQLSSSFVPKRKIIWSGKKKSKSGILELESKFPKFGLKKSKTNNRKGLNSPIKNNIKGEEPSSKYGNYTPNHKLRMQKKKTTGKPNWKQIFSTISKNQTRDIHMEESAKLIRTHSNTIKKYTLSSKKKNNLVESQGISVFNRAGATHQSRALKDVSQIDNSSLTKISKIGKKKIITLSMKNKPNVFNQISPINQNQRVKTSSKTGSILK